MVALAALYIVAGKLGLRLAFLHVSATAVWPPTGIALAAMLLFGRRVWPAILAGAFVVNVTTIGPPWSALGIAAGNTLEAVLGAYLVERYAHGRNVLDRARDVLVFTLLAAMVSTAVAATFGVGSLVLSGAAPSGDFGAIWLTWWLGDAGGDLVVAPLVLSWVASPRPRWAARRAVELAGLVLVSLVVAQLVFAKPFGADLDDYPLEFLCMPLFIWAAFRFHRRGVAVVGVIVYAIAVWGTLGGTGPFASGSPNQSLLLLQAFTCVVAATTLTLAAVIAERELAAERLEQLAASDPLTGLGNYRHLMTVLEREIQRSQRTGRTFAVLFVDVDDLKGLNDRLGHLVGSRALWRVGDMLRRTCRSIDTAARYGGDEFALVLPEADEAAARQVARRIADLLATDREEPRISVSSGIAVCPRDGTTVAELLAVADRAQYAQKRRHSPSPRARR